MASQELGIEQTPDTSDKQYQNHGIIAARKRDDYGHEEDIKYAKLLASDLKDTPPKYFMSVRFIGTIASLTLTVLSAYFGFAVPASVFSFINEDLGM
jgi:hypothetical protein